MIKKIKRKIKRKIKYKIKAHVKRKIYALFSGGSFAAIVYFFTK